MRWGIWRFENTETTETDTGIGEQGTETQASSHCGEIPLTAGYEKNLTNGFFIRSKDGQFRLNIGAYTQSRYDINWRDAPAGENDIPAFLVY